MSINNPIDRKIAILSPSVIVKNNEIIEKSSKNQIFISHSKNDQLGNQFFKNIFANSNTSGYWYSDHKTQPPHCEKIINVMRTCKSLFVILSSEMQNPHTASWVSFEVGVAKALGLNVWVFENPNHVAENISVPGADAYIQFPNHIPNISSHGYKKIIDQAGVLMPSRIGSNPYSTLTNNPLPKKKFNQVDIVKCGNDNCSQIYFMALLEGIWKYRCPACRSEFGFGIAQYEVDE